MIKKINSLRRKKGFTIIELIVVIGIIGILTTIIVATMSYDARPSVGKGLAKDLYYVCQDAITNVKVAHSKAFADFSGTTVPGVYVQLKSDGQIAEIQTIKVTASMGSLSASVEYEGALDVDKPLAVESNPKGDAAIKANDIKAYKNTIAHAISEYIATKDCYEGTYYVLFDKDYRVTKAYWSSTNEPMKGAAGMFTRECTLPSGELCCSYPVEFCGKGSVMFVKAEDGYGS